MANEDAVAWVEECEFSELAEAISYLLHQEFGHILRPSEDQAWYKAACGIVQGLDPIFVFGDGDFIVSSSTIRDLINKGPEVLT